MEDLAKVQIILWVGSDRIEIAVEGSPFDLDVLLTRAKEQAEAARNAHE